ncbi:hypothetical protein RUM44_001769 [Polyplax serrata]|uniref:Uncharacterized protein n=1 Tax=Polyplax serrata TaxID=468196 RepID=A0ABR1AL05_POLSC
MKRKDRPGSPTMKEKVAGCRLTSNDRKIRADTVDRAATGRQNHPNERRPVRRAHTPTSPTLPVYLGKPNLFFDIHKEVSLSRDKEGKSQRHGLLYSVFHLKYSLGFASLKSHQVFQ